MRLLQYVLAPTLVLILAMPLIGQSESSICYFSIDEARKDGTLLKQTPDPSVNHATIEELRILLHVFHLFPTFYFIVGQGDSNAYAIRKSEGEETDGTVAFGYSLIRDEVRARSVSEI